MPDLGLVLFPSAAGDPSLDRLLPVDHFPFAARGRGRLCLLEIGERNLGKDMG
jgi:hypothetical protein